MPFGGQTWSTESIGYSDAEALKLASVHVVDGVYATFADGAGTRFSSLRLAEPRFGDFYYPQSLDYTFLLAVFLSGTSSPRYDWSPLTPLRAVGSTCVAAKRTGRDYIGIELDGTHHQTATARLAAEERKAA